MRVLQMHCALAIIARFQQESFCARRLDLLLASDHTSTDRRELRANLKERVVIATVHDTALLKKKRNESNEGVTGVPGGVFAKRENDVKHGFRKLS
jgi:hypothetical protein